MKKMKEMKIVSLVEKERLVDYLRHERCKSFAADLIEGINATHGVRGSKPAKYLDISLIEQLIAPAIVYDVRRTNLVRKFTKDRIYVITKHSDI
jgi:hypothetical protein